MAEPKSTASEKSDRSALRRDLVENELYETATKLFAEKGFSATTFQDIAEAMGISRPALYYYVQSKDVLLERVVRQLTSDAPALFDKLVDDTSRPAEERLHDAVHRTVRMIAESPSRFKLVTLSETAMPSVLAEEWAEVQRRVRNDLIAIIKQGQLSGVFRPGDPAVYALGIVGMWNWVAWWFHPERRSPDAVADQLADAAVSGLLARHESIRTIDPKGLVDVIRRNVDLLDSLLDSDPTEPMTAAPTAKRRSSARGSGGTGSA